MDDVKICVHPSTQNPNKAWEEIQVHQKQEMVTPLHSDSPITEDNIRFVCISDTHSQIERDGHFNIPAGDVLIHAGDFTNVGLPKEVINFNDYLGTLPHEVKIVIAGNHELTFDDVLVREERDKLKNYFRITRKVYDDVLEEVNVTNIKQLLTNCIYLEDRTIGLCGLKIYGTPWQPEFCDWGFNLKRGQPCLEKWNLIPTDTDILISHGPPIGYGDACRRGQRAGCVELLSTVQKRVKPKYHIFGHIHEDYGVTTDGTTTFINASTCDLRYKIINPPVVFDMPIPEGHTKAELLVNKL